MLVENVPNSQGTANAAKDKAKELSDNYTNDAANAPYHSDHATNAPPRRLSLRARDAEGHVHNTEPVKTPRRRPSNAELSSRSQSQHQQQQRQQQEKGGSANKAAAPKEEGETFSEFGSDVPEAAAAAPVPLPHPTPTPTKTKAAAKPKTSSHPNPADEVVVTTHRRVFEGNGWTSLLASAYSTVERTVLNETSQATNIPDNSIRVVSLAMEGGRLVAEIALVHDATLTEAALQKTLDTYPYNGMRMLMEMQEEKPQQPTGLGAVLAGMTPRKDVNNANKSNNVNKNDKDSESEVDSESLVLVEEKGEGEEKEEDGSPAEAADTTRGTTTTVPEVPADASEDKDIEFTEEPEPSVNAAEAQKKKIPTTNKEKEVTTPRVPQAAGTHKQSATPTPKTPRTPQAAATHKQNGTPTPKTPRTPQAAATHKQNGTPTPKTPRTPQAAATHKQNGTPTPKTPRTPQAAATHKQSGTATPKTPRTPQAAATHKHDGTATPRTPLTPQAAATHKHDGTATPKTPRTPQAADTHKQNGTTAPKTPRTPRAGNHKHDGTTAPKTPRTPRAGNHKHDGTTVPKTPRAGTHKQDGTATPKTPRTPRHAGKKAKSPSSTPRLSLTPRAGNPADQANLQLPLRSPRAGSSRRRYSGMPNTARTYGSTTPRRRSAYDAGGRAVSSERARSQTPSRRSRKNSQDMYEQGLACNAILERWQKTGVLRRNERPIPPQRVIRVGVSQWPRTPRISAPEQASGADADPAENHTPTVSTGVNEYATGHHGDTVNDFEESHDKYDEVQVPPVSAPSPVREESNDHSYPQQYEPEPQPQPQPQRRHSPLKDTPGISHGLRSPVRHNRVPEADEAVKKHSSSGSNSSISWDEEVVIEEKVYA